MQSYFRIYDIKQVFKFASVKLLLCILIDTKIWLHLANHQNNGMK